MAQARRKHQQKRAAQARALLAWYDRHRRRLPWRAEKGEKPEAYRVWLAEIMLQQTTVQTVGPYYARFLARFPDLQHLASAKLVEVLKLWAGLGYYARARNLHACARTLLGRHGGRFPQDENELRALPGIGGYTAAAIAAIAFGRKATPVDGNVERVVARLFALEAALPAAKPAIRALSATLTPARRPGDFAQAMMDLGATICTPKRPACARCPWNAACAARRRGDPESFPRKTAKAQGRLRRGAAFVVLREDGALLLRTRAPKGLLGGMSEVPTSAWRCDFDERNALAHAPEFSPLPSRSRMFPTSAKLLSDRTRVNPSSVGEREIKWRRVPGRVTHSFTHFPLELIVYKAVVARGAKPTAGARWHKVETLSGEALPNVMRKVIAHALD